MYQAVRSRFLEYQQGDDTSARAERMRETRLQHARAYIRRSDFGNATARLAEVIRMAPEHPTAYGLLGVIDAAAGHVEEARSNFRKFEDYGGDEAEIFQRWGHLEYKNGNFEIAVEKLTRACDLRPDDSVYRHFLGVALWRFGLRHLPQMQVERALELFRKAEEAFRLGYFLNADRPFQWDHNEKNHSARISNLIALRDFKSARETVAMAQKDYPGSPDLSALAERVEREELAFKTSGAARRAEIAKRTRLNTEIAKPPRST